MNKLILFLVFLPLISIAKEPKYHYKDCVKVTSGFYKGCRGYTESYIEPDTYIVTADCGAMESVDITINEKQLEPNKSCR